MNANDGQEVIYQDLNKVSSLLQREIYDRVILELLQRVDTGVFQDSFAVSYVGSAVVSVNQGTGFQKDAAAVSPEPQQKMLYLENSFSQALSPPHTSNDRIDVICLRAALVDSNQQSRKYKAMISSTPQNTPLYTEKEWASELLVVAGTPAGSPTIPATPAGYIALAQVLVHAVAGVGSQADITDVRAKLPIGGGVVLNTLGLTRVTAGAAVPLSTLISDIDTLLRVGRLIYTDLDNLGASPAAPVAGRRRLYVKNGVLVTQDDAGVESLLGGGGGGGGGANWFGADG